MKKNYFAFSVVLLMLYITLSSDVDGPAHHGHGNITGSTTGTTGHCQTSSCHGGNNPVTIVQLQVLDTATMLPVTVYNSSQTYLVTITGNDTGVSTTLPSFGFQASAVLGDHTQAGTFTIPSALASSIHTYPCGSTTVVEHSTPLAPVTTGVNKYATQFYWTAPATYTDSVTFYALLNAVNGDGGKSGDYPNEAPTVTIHQNPADAVASVSNNIADYNFAVYPNPATDNAVMSYSLSSEQQVRIFISDITGKIIAVLADNELQQGGYHRYYPLLTAPGLYFVHLETGGMVIARKFVKL